MLLKIEGTSTIKASPERVFNFLIDPNTVGGSFPDVQSIEVLDDETFKAKVKTGISYIGGVFDFKFNITRKRAPASVTLVGHGIGRGSTLNLATTIDLTSNHEGMTQVRWTTEADVSGFMAKIGSQFLETAAGKLVTLLFLNIRNELE